MIDGITIPALRCTCNLCGHVWVSTGSTPPRECKQCGSRQWNGQKIRHIQRPIELPKPRRVRSIE